MKGHLSPERTEWSESLTITQVDNGETLLSGPVVDQAALHGLLRKIRDLGIPLISILRVDTNKDEASDDAPDRSNRQETGSTA
jgi:hypothetical protein